MEFRSGCFWVFLRRAVIHLSLAKILSAKRIHQFQTVEEGGKQDNHSLCQLPRCG
jgi:hypothetical protein